ncbi:MAG: gliding motility-associated C-terminal domain-containing protein [Bacteroidales bacterium]
MAQLTAPGSSSIRLVSDRWASTVEDQAFFYCNTDSAEGGTLSASSLKGTGNRNFNWYQWNDSATSFSKLIKSENGVFSSTMDSLPEGGYKVDIDSAGIHDTTFVGWIFFDRPPVASASLAQQLCYRVALHGVAQASVDTFYCRNINTGAIIPVANEITHLWSSVPSSYIPAPDIYLDPVIENYPAYPPFINYNLPLEDVTYTLTVTSLGCSSQSSFLYSSIHVRADFTADPVKGEAPLDVTFTNTSIRGSTYTWNFGDNTTSDLETPPVHTYNIPGKYTVTLIIQSDLHCLDSLRMDSLIYVEPSELSIPNAFTPNGDGFNDRFMIYGQSLRYVSMEVFSQSGMKVYGFSGEGEILKNWTGWDGNINNTSIKASPGIYFYVITALGWDNVVYDSKQYRGFVYLYR